MAKIPLSSRVAAALADLIPDIKIGQWDDPETTGDNPNERWLDIPIAIPDNDKVRYSLTIMFNDKTDMITGIELYEETRQWETGERLGVTKLKEE